MTTGFKSAGCEHPTAQQAVLTEVDAARAVRHPYGGTRPEWSGHCVSARCECPCHLTLEEPLDLAGFSLSLDGAQLAEAYDFDDDETIQGSCGCGARWTGEAICHCAACHLTFTSVGPFDFHRYHDRCRTPEELHEKGYQPNASGHWRKPMEGESPWSPTELDRDRDGVACDESA